MRLKDEHDYDPTFATKARVKAEVPSDVDVAIVGAGLGGLSAGAYLAKAGYRVAVFDQHYVAGGCCTQFSRGGPKARYNFDVGLHYIGDCGDDGMIPRLLAGVDANVNYVPMNQDGFDTLVFPDFNFRIPADHDMYQQRLIELFPKEKKGIQRFVRFLKEVDQFSRKMDAAKGKMGTGMAVWAATKGRLAAKYQQATLGEVMDSCTKNPELRAVFAGQNGDYGIPPDRVAAVLHAGLSNHYFRGAYYPEGGGQLPADNLAASIERNGGSVHLRRGVSEIVVEGGKTVGVQTENHKGQTQFTKAKAVLSNADLRVTFEQLIKPEHLPEDWKAKSDNWEMAAALFMTCTGVKGDMKSRGMDVSNYWQFDGYDFDEFYKPRPDMMPLGCYITSASLKDPGTSHHAPEGIQSLEVMAVLPGEAKYWGTDQDGAEQWKYKKTEKYVDLKQRVEDNLIQRVDKLFPGTADNIVFKESATPMSHIRYTRASDGTGYGLACTPEQFFGNRPGYEGPIDGLFLAGANTRSGHGVAGSLQSGHRAAKKVARALGGNVADVPDRA